MQQSAGLLLAVSLMAATPLFSFAFAKENANESLSHYTESFSSSIENLCFK
jgi:hypothetical protein